MEQKKEFHLEVLTPDGKTFDDTVVSVSLPALDGYMGVMAGRSPVTAIIATGTLTIRMPGERTEKWFVSHGFCQMRQNELTVLAEESRPLDQLDPKRAWDLLQRAYGMPKDTYEQRKLRDQAIADCRIRFNLAQKGKKAQAKKGEDDGSMMTLDALMSSQTQSQQGQ